MIALAIGGGVAVLLALAGGVWVIRARRGGRIESPEQAAAAADDLLAGFATSGAVVGADGAGALAIDRSGRVAVMKRDGPRIAVREVPWSAVRSTRDGIVVETEERRFGHVAIAGVDALDVRRLAPVAMRGGRSAAEAL